MNCRSGWSTARAATDDDGTPSGTRYFWAATPGATYAALSAATGLSQGEAHNAVRRLRGARLVLANAQMVHRAALLEFLGAGVAYAFPAEAGAESRGVPTAHSAGELAAEFGVSDPLVWPSVAGRVRGASVVPLYAAAPTTAARNPALYELLALVDAVRLGRARERTRAKQLLHERIMSAASAVAAV